MSGQDQVATVVALDLDLSPSLRGVPAEPHHEHGVPGLVRARYDAHRDVVTCVDCAGGALTLHDVEVLSDEVARRLLGASATPGMVLVCTPSTVARVVAVLGVLKAGCAFVPVAARESAARLETIAALADPVAVIGEVASVPDVPRVEVPTSTSDVAPEHLRAVPAELAVVDPHHPVYVMFTSGSTGEPKGVVVGSAALVSNLRWTMSHFPMADDDRVLQKTLPTFDPSVWEILVPLMGPGTCVFPPPEAQLEPQALVRVLREQQITVCPWVPSLLTQFIEAVGADVPPTLRRVLASGETLPAPLTRSVGRLWPHTTLHNLYGPTETTIHATCWDVPHGGIEDGPVPIGWPVTGTDMVVLGEDGSPRPPGEPGELWIGGVQLAEGYASRPERTAESFHVVAGRRWYRTGDRVRVTPDGLVYLGRADDQLKISGVRVEPGEVEACIGELVHPVGVVGAQQGGARVLAAVLGGAGAGAVSDDEVRRHVGGRLPSAMVPSIVLRLDALPTGRTGKLDRNRLTSLVDSLLAGDDGSATSDVGSPTDTADVGPDGDWLGPLWTRSLSVGRAEESASFRSLGGGSLTAISLAAAVRERTGVELPVSRMLTGDVTLAELRAIVDRAGALSSAVPSEGSSRPRDWSPLTPEQRRVWLLGRLRPRSAAYNVCAFVRIDAGPDGALLDGDALEVALRLAQDRWDVLRCRVDDKGEVDTDGRLVVPVLRYAAAADTEVAVLLDRSHAAGPLDEAIEGFVRAAQAEVIPDGSAPMWRASLLTSARGGQCLALVLHHMVGDQATLRLVLETVATAYDGLVGGSGAAGTGAAPSFADHAHVAADASAGRRWSKDLEYWRNRLSGAPPFLTLPFTRIDSDPDHTDPGHCLDLRLDDDLSLRLARLRADRGTSPSTVLLAGLAVVLGAWSGQQTVVVGLPVNSRASGTEQELAGFLVSTVAVRVDLLRCRTVGDVVKHARARHLEALDHIGVSFDAVVEALGVGGGTARSPVFQVWLNDLGEDEPPPTIGGLRTSNLRAADQGALFDVGLYVQGRDVRLVWRSAVVEDRLAAALLHQTLAVVEAAAADPETPLSSLVLEPSVGVGGAPDLPHPGTDSGHGQHRGSGSIVERVRTRVRSHPEAVALRSVDGEVSYAELWARSLATAAGLRAQDLGADDVLAVLATRSPDLPLAVLGGWVAGATVALIGPLPELAAAQVLRMVDPALTVTTGRTGGDGILTVADLAAGSPPAPDRTPPPPADPSHLLATSGSTGVPRVVAVRPGALEAFLDWYVPCVGLSARDRVALVAGPGHDPVLREMFATFVAGSTLCVPPTAAVENPVELLGWLEAEGITVLHATPALLDLLLTVAAESDDPCDLTSLRLVVAGGAPLTWGVVRRLRALTPARVLNGYGTTETPQLVACAEADVESGVDRPDEAQVPVGAGVAGHRLLVLTPDGSPTAVGQRGEVVVESPTATTSYHRAGPGHLFESDDPGGRARFRTGDLGRRDPDGHVHLDGRRDRQVSVSGHRVELGEVEAATASHPAVRHAIAGLEEGAEGSLTVRVTATGPLDVEDLRHHLAARLSPHARPARIEVVGRFSLGPTGKARFGASERQGTMVRPERDAGVGGRGLAARLARSVEDLTGRRPGPEENFFDAGLTSMDLVRLQSVVSRDLDRQVPVTAFFAHPNLLALGAFLDGDVPDPDTAGQARDVARSDGQDAARARRAARRRIAGPGRGAGER